MNIRTHLFLFDSVPRAVVVIGAVVGVWLVTYTENAYDAAMTFLIVMLTALAAWLAMRVSFRFVAASCDRCAGPSFASFQTGNLPITYTCRSCDHRHKTKVFEKGGD
jgi:hypothetical protein